MDSAPSLLASTVMSFHARRQVQGLPPLTPAQLAEIDFSNKSTLTTPVWVVSGLVVGLICVVVPTRLALRQKTTGRILLDDCQSSTKPPVPVLKLICPATGLVILASLFTLVVCAMALAGMRILISYQSMRSLGD